VRSVLVALAVLGLAGCGGDASSDGPTVVAAFYPLAWAAERVSGEELRVVNLTPPGAEPHDVELSPRDVERIRDADVVIYASGFQPAVDDAVRDRHGPSLDVLREGERDPHVWLDPVRFAAVVRDIGTALGRVEPAEDLAEELAQLDDGYRRSLQSCAHRVLVTSHAAFAQLAARYSLRQLSLAGASPESEPTPRDLERLVERVRGSGATTVFAEPLVSDRLAATVAREAGVHVALLDPIEGLSEERLQAGEDYLTVMRDNLAALREALACA
jgi:zinc transport system substrate-binding protein